MVSITRALVFDWLTILQNLIQGWPTWVWQRIRSVPEWISEVFLWIKANLDQLFGWFEQFYEGNRRLLALQCNVSLLGAFVCLWVSKIIQNHTNGLLRLNVLAAFIVYYVGFFRRSMRQNHNREVRHRLNMSPAMSTSLNWFFQTVTNCIAGNIAADSDYADWYASGAFFLFYIHFLSFLKLRGGAADFGAASSAWNITVAFISHVLGGFFATLVIPVLSAIYVLYQEILKLPPCNDDEVEDGTGITDDSVVVGGSREDSPVVGGSTVNDSTSTTTLLRIMAP